MNKFWPHRPSPKGFSIEKLAKKYREKINNTTTSSNHLFNLSERPENSDKSKKHLTSLTNIHWVNRDFLEYKDVA